MDDKIVGFFEHLNNLKVILNWLVVKIFTLIIWLNSFLF